MALDGELEALLTSETLPPVLPVTVGANCTLRLLVCPAESVRGKVCPVVVKPAPLTAAWETVKLLVPALLKVTVCVLAVPTSTSPKATLLGLMLSWPLPEGGGVFWPAIPEHPAMESQENSVRTSVRPLLRKRLSLREFSSAWHPVRGWLRRLIIRGRCNSLAQTYSPTSSEPV